MRIAKYSSSLILDSANAFLFLDRLDLSPIDKASPHTPKLKLSYTVAYNERKPSISIEYKRLVAEWRPFEQVSTLTFHASLGECSLGPVSVSV
jgi:hypothetical protein